MKKAFLFLTMLLFAFIGTMRADEVTICDGTVTNDYIPVYGFYADTQGCQSEFVIPASEIGILPGGQISKLTFYLSTPATAAWTATFQVYMTEIEGTTLSAFVGPSGCTQVYQGALNGTGSTMEIVFDNNYTYNGGNLLIGTFVSTAGDYKSAYFYGVTAAGASIQRNSSSASTSQRNFLPKTTIEFVQGDLPATTIVPSENPVQLGVRPIGAWMKPYEFAITNQGTPTTVTGVDGTANFAVEAEVPYALGYNGTMPISVTTTGTPAAGTLNGQVLVSYSDRTFTTIDATAEMYEPVDGDVWEMAEEVTAMPFQGNAPTGIYRNYELGQADDAADAVYKVTFDNDVLFSAGTNGAGAKTRLYTEDFNGVGGPDADNNYVYNGPTVNPGPMQMWFSYAYSGSNTWYGLTEGGGFYYGYQIPASYIEELGLAGTSITTVEAAARESYDYECYIIKGGATPFDGELVSFGVAESPEALYFFDINLEEPVLVDEGEDIWVIFYSDSPFAAYCGRIPVDATNGKIWTYNPNASSPAWNSYTSYTPVIYTRFIELPTGREVTVDLGSMKIKEGNGVASAIAAIDGTAMGVSKAQMYNEAKAQNTRGNRDEIVIGDPTATTTNSYLPTYSLYEYSLTEQIYTADEIGMAGTINTLTMWLKNSSSYARNINVYMKEADVVTFADGNAWVSMEDSDMVASFTLANGISSPVETAIALNTPFNYSGNGNLVICFQDVTGSWGSGAASVVMTGNGNQAIYDSRDDIVYNPTTPGVTGSVTTAKSVIMLDITSGGGSTDPVYQIADMYVPAGTYYVAVASKTENFQVDMMTSEVPAPEQAVVVSPYDGETYVESPYLAEWILGDYTAEMQVLVGTQYPPQTALIDWTDYLVESAFLMDLEPNQSYFMQVNARNAAGTTEGEIIAFTTPIDPVEGFAVENDQLYPGEAAVFTWEANARTLKGYNLYMDGVKVNESPITGTEYAVEDLEYNMTGYEFQLTAVYDAGESLPTESINVKMTGFGTIMGHVYDAPDGYDPEDPDQSHPVAGIPVTVLVLDEYAQTQNYEFVTDEEGFYTGEVLAASTCVPGISIENAAEYGYAVAVIVGYTTTVAYNQVVEGLDIYTHEYYYPLQQITATEQEAENNVLVEWSWTPAEMIVDFESGDFSQADFTLPAQYPWVITTTHPYEGTYCMKSTCEGQASASSSIEATVDVPFDGLMGFWVKVSSESNYDKFHFYIDGVEQGSAMSGNLDYQYKEYVVSEGTHTYKWEYAKDSSVNSNDDCVYVDYVTMYKQAGPAPSGQSYNFDDSSLQGWTSLDADGDGNGWLVASEAMSTGYGHNASTDCVLSKSYDNTYGVLYPDNYLVSPFKMNAQNGAAITFWACGQDASYAAEHFGVAVSTGSNNTAADFTTIQEWTMTAKGAAAEDAYSEIRGTRTQGTWYEYTVDLSSYAGQEIWVAIRHFNCSDMFYLDVDDITLGDGSEVAMTRGGNRSLMSYNLYRRNNIDPESMADPELIAPGIAADVMSYIDNEWDELDFGEYQWGIQATYEGYAPEADRSRETYTYTFDSGLEGWTNIDADGDGNVWYNSANSVAISGYDYSTLGHNGTGCFMVSQSYTDLTSAPFNADNYLVSPQKYAVDASSSITFWHDYANDSYPDYYEVMVSTAANPGANDFTAVWTSGSKSTGNGAKIRNTNSRYENWQEQTVSLAAYAGQEVWIAFHHEDYDNYEIWIDDVTITAGSAPTPGPTPGPTGNGLSEILWSNVIDKDMVSTVKFAVALNNGQSPAGAEIELTGIYNEYEFTVESDTLVVEMRKDVYAVAVELEGYYPFEGELDLDEDEEIMTIVLTEIIAPVSDFYVSPTGWAKWEGTTGGGVTPTPPTPPTGASTFSEGFEGGMPADWTVVDANGDGYTWCMTSAIPSTWTYYSSMTLDWYRTGTNAICSGSYINGVGALTPDEYLVMGQQTIANGSTLSFWAAATDATYAADHFGVFVSDNGTSDWTSVQEWTLTAKESTLKGGRESREGDGAKLGTWYQYTVDLSAYAGQKYIAIRHFNCNDQYIMCVDDIELTAGRGDRAALSYKVFLEGEYVGETVYPFYQVPVAGLTEGETYTVAVAPLYATGMGETMYASFVYEACSHYAGATEYTATVNDNNVALSWTLNGQPGPQPGPGAGSFTCGFEEGLPEGWTVLDGNNDGWTWCLTSAIPSTWTYYASLTLDWYRTGSNAICSGSYINGVGALTPNEYLVTPQVTIGAGSTFSFWAAATDATYAADHFGVFVSDNGTSDWTSVQEWTLTAKESTLKGGRESREGDGAKLGTWYQYTVDLSAYAGNKYIAIRHFNCNDQYIMCVDDVEFAASSKGGNRDMWDYLTSFTGTSAGQQAVATDGEYIYTASWQTTPTGGYTFYKYDLEGNFVEGFDIAGATGIRDLTFDGDYFYGTSGGAQIFCLDLANKTLVSTINCSGLTSRHISYDPERDGFWSGNWTTLALYSRTGALIQNGPTTTSAYGSAYYKDSDNVEHLFLFCQPNSDCQVYDYNITTGTLSASPVLDYTSTTPGCTGIAGGCFIGGYDGKTCWFGNSQQDPNLIAIYELDSEGPTPGPQPIPGDILGVMVWRDGEPLTMEPITATSYTDANVAAGEHEYCIRVVYSDWAMACDQCETVTVGEGPACDPVTNLTAEPYTYNGNDGALIQFTEPAGATSYKVYVDGQLLGSMAAQPIFINFEGSGDGNYEIGIVAVYAECESDMATVMFTWDSVNEAEVVNAIYPNPTSSDLHINATAMTHVTVYNAMGQMVLDQEVSGDEVILNMGQFEAGIYMVKVTTETGSSVKRITVAK